MKKSCMQSKLFYSAVAVALLMLSACGGGGTPAHTGTIEIPTQPTDTALTVGGKSLDFSWTAGENVDHYRILVSPDGASGFTVDPTASNIASTATSHSLEIPVHKTNWFDAKYIVEACDAAEQFCIASSNQTLTLIDSVAAIIYMKASNTEAGDWFGYAVSLSADGNTLAVGARKEASSATGIDGDQVDNGADASGAVYIYSRTGSTWSQQAYVKASNTGEDDYFGNAVSLSADGNTLAVGAPVEASPATGIDGNQADNGAGRSGAVYIYSRTESTWSQQAYVKASNTGSIDNFGHAVSLSADSNTLAVGAFREASAATGIGGDQANNGAKNSGAVYIFSRTGSTWSQQAYVKASNTGGNDRFGNAVSLSADGNTLAVGAVGKDSADGNQADNGAGGSGAVYIYSRTGSTWSQQAYVKASNTEAGDYFGIAVSLSADGSTLAVGAAGEASAATGIDGNQADNEASRSGAVYIYSRTGSTWLQQAYVKASNTGSIDYFGYAVSLSADGNTLAVGAGGEESSATGIGGDQADNGVSSSGAIYIYSHVGSAWSQQAYVKASNTGGNDHDQFGYAVSLSADGNTLAVGAFRESSAATGIGGDQADNGASYSGAVYLY